MPSRLIFPYARKPSLFDSEALDCFDICTWFVPTVVRSRQKAAQQFLLNVSEWWNTDLNVFGQCFSCSNVYILITCGSCIDADSDSVGLEYGLRFSVSDKFPSGTSVADLCHTLTSVWRNLGSVQTLAVYPLFFFWQWCCIT